MSTWEDTTKTVAPILSVAFPVLVAISVRLCGKRDTEGWLVGFIAQLAYGAFAISTKNWYGLINLIIVAPVFLITYREWRRKDSEVRSASQG